MRTYWTIQVAPRKIERYSQFMGIPVERLTEAALALPADARALLADRLTESLDPLMDDEIRGLWVEEAIRRRDEVRSGQVQTIPADVALRQVRESLRK